MKFLIFGLILFSAVTIYGADSSTILQKRDADAAIHRAIAGITEMRTKGDELVLELTKQTAEFTKYLARLNGALTVGGDDGQIVYNNIKSELDVKKKALHTLLSKYGATLEAEI